MGMGSLSQPQIVAAIIALIGAAIVVPLVKKYYFDVQHRLRVDVRAYSAKTSNAVKAIMTTFSTANIFGDPLASCISANGYTRVTITNTSRKKISGISVIIADFFFDAVCQLDDEDTLTSFKKGTVIGIGDIQPKHSRTLHMWSAQDRSDSHFVAFKAFLTISANELDAIHLRYPAPRYITTRYENFRYFIIIIALMGAATLLGYIMPIFWAFVAKIT